MSFTYIGFIDGVITFEYNGQYIQNPFEVSLQAMLGEKVNSVYENENNGNLIPRYYRFEELEDVTKEEYALKAINWLKCNAKELGDCIYWEYNYDIIYNNEHIKSPWKSAYAQSYAVMALLYWYINTNENEYLNLAQKAANLLSLDLESGGVLYNKNNLYWFEEIPNKYPTHILNAHMVSLIALFFLKKYSNIEVYDNIIKSAHSSLLNNIYKYHNVLGSAYEIYSSTSVILKIQPFIKMNFFRINKEKPYFSIKNIEIISGKKDKYRKIDTIDMNAFDTGRDIYISGIDWGDLISENYRKINLNLNNPELTNIYLCFNGYTLEEKIDIKIEYKTNMKSKLKFSINNSTGEYVHLRELRDLNMSGNCLLSLNEYDLYAPLSSIYQEYHIVLLKEIEKIFKCNKIKKFRKKIEKSYKNSN